MFSIVCPMDDNRLEQFISTKQAYDDMPFKKEFIIPTRTKDIIEPFMKERGLLKGVKFFPYTIEQGFNPSKALNIGVRNSKYQNILITGPEVRPFPDTLEKLSECLDQNIICQTWDEDENGNLTSLVYNGYRSETPQPYFLGMFRKEDIEKINGWDENFMDGYAYEDSDFGARWVRAGIPFIVREDIQATHQWHPRHETIPGGMVRNQQIFYDNTDKGITYCENGLKNGKIDPTRADG